MTHCMSLHRVTFMYGSALLSGMHAWRNVVAGFFNAGSWTVPCCFQSKYFSHLHHYARHLAYSHLPVGLFFYCRCFDEGFAVSIVLSSGSWIVCSIILVNTFHIQHCTAFCILTSICRWCVCPECTDDGTTVCCFWSSGSRKVFPLFLVCIFHIYSTFPTFPHSHIHVLICVSTWDACSTGVVQRATWLLGMSSSVPLVFFVIFHIFNTLPVM